MMKYDGGKVRVGRQKGLFVHKVSDSLQPEKKKDFQNPAHLILKWNGLGMDSLKKKIKCLFPSLATPRTAEDQTPAGWASTGASYDYIQEHKT